VQPAAGDAGGALGAALAAHHELEGRARVPQLPDAMKGSYLGPEFPDDEIERSLTAAGATYERLASPDMIERTARSLADGEVVGWFQGRMEFGPRALGARSILGDPRSPTMQTALNLKVKRRESFRPFAPSVLREDAAAWFDLDVDSPYMLLVAPVATPRQRATTPDEDALVGIEKLRVVRSDIPAVTHVDQSARIQTVHRETNHLYHSLLVEFKRLTGCPVLVNTSFNVRGEPIVCTPEDALRCFMTTNIDVLVAGSCVLTKRDQDPSRTLDQVAAGALD
jgi:carbamoyltransferase